jgi:hypothetical protein
MIWTSTINPYGCSERHVISQEIVSLAVQNPRPAKSIACSSSVISDEILNRH